MTYKTIRMIKITLVALAVAAFYWFLRFMGTP